ncbi:MAG: TonB-dependent receptor [Flavobacteriaceae bacterium]|jgi:outer membrane receptor protein involved in Fe transport|nr:TonB-dependent receptor [Flavobacteriaceae bacterium]
MKNQLLLLAISLLSFTTQAQIAIKGKIVDEQQRPIDYAEIYLFQNQEELIKNAFSDIDGIFHIDINTSGNYSLQINYAGKQLYKQSLQLMNTTDLGTIQINTQTQLDEVVIQAEKKLVERKVDRLVYNTANSIASQGMDALEALSNTPMVKVQNDKVSIVGKSGVTIMVDERILHLSGDALTNYLKTLRSDDIEKIEVITTPPAKYEAAGNSGMINIVMKKNRKAGLYGTVSGTAAYNKNSSYNGNGTLNFQNKKWNIMAKVNAYDSKYWNHNQYSYKGETNGLQSSNTSNGSYSNYGGSLTANYQLTTNTLIGASYDLTNAKNNTTKNNTSDYFSYPNNQLTNQVEATTIDDSKNSYHTINTFLEHKLDTLGSQLTVGVNFFGNAPDSNSNISDQSSITGINNKMLYNNNLKYHVWSTNADLSYKLSWATIETGAKFTQYNNESTVAYYIFKNNDYEYDMSRSNNFNYNESNYAGYISLTKKINDKWNIKGGLRYEQTEATGKLIETGEQFNKSYGKWFPTAYVSYNPNDTHNFSLNYSKRINRPYSHILNPFKYYQNTYSYYSGNPELDPAFTDNFEVSYTYDSKLTITANYYTIKGSFDQYSVFENNIFKSTYFNMLNTDNYGIDISYNNKVFNWWETNTAANTYYATSYFTTNAPQIPQNGLVFSYYSYNTFNINNAKTVKLLLNWYHQLPYKEDNTRYHSYSSLSTGIKVSLLNKNLNINGNISDVFNSGKSDGTVYYNDNIQSFKNRWNSRRFNLSVSYTFGDSNNKKSIKEASFEDSQRSKQ